MNALRAIFRKEWTEAKRDPRAWLLTLVVPVLFYPAALWLGAGGMRQGPLRVAVADPWLAGQLDGTPALTIVPAGAAGADAEVTVLAMDPGFPDAGRLWVGINCPGSALLAAPEVERAVAGVGRRLATERATAAGLGAADLDPVVMPRPAATSAAGESSALLAYLLVFVVFTGCLATAVDSGAGERERGGMEALLATPAAPLAIAGGKVLFIMVTGIASVLASLAGLAAAVLLAGGSGGLVGSLGLLPLLAVGTLLIGCSGLISSWLFACSLGARSAREAHAWISGLFLLVSLGLIWTTFGAGANASHVAWLPLFGAARAIGRVLDATASPLDCLAAAAASLAGWAAGMAACARLLQREATLRAC